MDQSFDILSFGSLTVDIFIDPHESDICQDTDHDAEPDKFVFAIGDKVGVKNIIKACGGGAANTSVGFAKLGLKSGAFGVVGDDTDSLFIEQELEKNQVATDFLIREQGEKPSTSVILMTCDGRRTVFHYRNTNPALGQNVLDQAPCARAIYVGHLDEEAEGLLKDIPAWKSRCGGLVAWNPGKTQFAQGLEAFQKILPSIDVLILNVQEGEMFTGKKAVKLAAGEASEAITGEKVMAGDTEYPAKYLYDVRDIAQRFLEAGIGKVVLTDGKRGAQLFDQEGHHFFTPAQHHEPVCTLGAGDAFSVGVVGAMIHEKPTKQQMVWGNRNADGVIREFGAQNGQRSVGELEVLG